MLTSLSFMAATTEGSGSLTEADPVTPQETDMNDIQTVINNMEIFFIARLHFIAIYEILPNSPYIHSRVSDFVDLPGN